MRVNIQLIHARYINIAVLNKSAKYTIVTLKYSLCCDFRTNYMQIYIEYYKLTVCLDRPHGYERELCVLA